MANLSLIINGVTFKSLEQMLGAPPVCVADGKYYSCDASTGFGPPPLLTSLEYEDREVVFPAVDDISTKRFGRRGRHLSCNLLYIYATKLLAETAIEADFATSFIQLKRYDITLPGTTVLHGWKLLQGGARQTTWGPPMGQKTVAQVLANFKQYSLTN